MQPVEHLYVHVPFCPRVCPYCSFYVEPADGRKAGPLVDALLSEMTFWRDQVNLSPRTIFLGGGTPSALSTKDLGRLVSALSMVGKAEEFTIEINPTTLSHEKARMLLDHGINRVSLGAQSFVQAELSALGRQHSPDRILRTYELLRGAGFRNVSIDLMFATPGQTADTWTHSLQTALQLKPEHLSAYCLTFEEDTPFFESLNAGRLKRDVHLEELYYQNAIEQLEAAGLHQYEVSNFATRGNESQHNLAYWRGHDYLGLGPSAVSTINGKRWKNVPDTVLYLQGAMSGNWNHVEEETLTAELLIRERLIFGLRTREGVVAGPWQEQMQKLASAGYAIQESGRWHLTREGLLRADAVAEWLI